MDDRTWEADTLSETAAPPLKEDGQETATGEDRSRRRVESLYEWVEMAVFALAAVVLIFAFLFRVVSVDGSSMNPTLLHGERLIVTSNAYTPQRGDIVIINRYVKEPLVKRIIAVGGDTLTINPDTHEVAVNGTVLDEPYIQGVTEPLYFQPTTQTVPEGYVFVMGDNREYSSDSRYGSIGYISERDIVGKAVFRLFPLDAFGGLY